MSTRLAVLQVSKRSVKRVNILPLFSVVHATPPVQSSLTLHTRHFAALSSPLITTLSSPCGHSVTTSSPAQSRPYSSTMPSGNGSSSHPAEHQAGEGTQGKHEWKTRPPYSIHDKEFDAKLQASCHCGKVEYQLSREEPLDSKLCHCTTCQRQHAAPFQWAAVFHKTDINFTKGHHGLEWYDPTDKSIEHKLPCKVRCSYCHSPIMDEGRNMILLFPTLVKFEGDEQRKLFAPKLHMFYGERVVDVPDGLPKWAGMKDESELIADSPPDLVKEVEQRKRKNEEEHKDGNGEKKEKKK